VKEPETLVVDHSGVDKVKEWRYAAFDTMSLRDSNRETPIPEEWMAKLAGCLGDAQAQVTVSADLGSNNYGTKAGSFVSVKVTCGNNEKDIGSALDIAREIAESKVQENFKRMQDVLDSALKPSGTNIPNKALEPPQQPRAMTGKLQPPSFRK
jgi:hypothetical protein